MGDSACVMQSFEHSSVQQGDPVIRALGESVSFGRFVTETLEWEKWSTFNQNRYLEEAKRFAKPGLVAQKKALFEAHFKKIAADRAAAALMELEASNSSTDCEPCVEFESGEFERFCSADATRNSGEADGSLILDYSHAVPLLESQSDEAFCDEEENDSAMEVSDFGSVNNSDPADFVQKDGRRCHLAVDTTQDVELCDKMDILSNTSKSNQMDVVVEPSLFQKFDPPEDMNTDSDRSEVANNYTMPLDDPQKEIAVQLIIQEPVHRDVLSSDGKYKPTLTCSRTLAPVTKPVLRSNSNLRPPAHSRKENDTARNTRAFGSAMLNKKKVTTKSLHLDCDHQDFKRPLPPKKLDTAKSPTNSASLRSFKERPDQVTIITGSQKRLATTSNTLSAVRKSSVELYVRPAPPQLKEYKTVMRRDSASMQNSVNVRKSMPKSLHMPICLGSRVEEKERHISLQRTGTKIDATSVNISMTHSAHAPANQVIPDSTLRRKQIIPLSNSTAYGTKLIAQHHAKPTPPLYKSKNSVVQGNSALTLSQTHMKKYLPKSLHMSADLSSTVGVVRKPTLAQKRGNSSINIPDVKASRPSSSQKMDRDKVGNTVSGMKNTEKCPPHKMDHPNIPTNPIRPPSPTVSTPFRFRSDERAAKHKEKLEEKYKVKSENSKQRIGKFTSSWPQSPMYGRKSSPGKARETKNGKPAQAPATGKIGSHHVTGNKTSTTITLLPRKTACENASPNIEI